jgi:hypothetical protein
MVEALRTSHAASVSQSKFLARLGYQSSNPPPLHHLNQIVCSGSRCWPDQGQPRTPREFGSFSQL